MTDTLFLADIAYTSVMYISTRAGRDYMENKDYRSNRSDYCPTLINDFQVVRCQVQPGTTQNGVPSE